jgi:hypothetical protein
MLEEHKDEKGFFGIGAEDLKKQLELIEQSDRLLATPDSRRILNAQEISRIIEDKGTME